MKILKSTVSGMSEFSWKPCAFTHRNRQKSANFFILCKLLAFSVDIRWPWKFDDYFCITLTEVWTDVWNSFPSTTVEFRTNGLFRYYNEIEKERRVRKRRSRLEAAVEDAFSLVHRQRSSHQSASDVASEVWPTLARSMQKYLRTTR